MSDPLILWAFAAAAVAIVVVPGADMAIILTSALGGGRAAGLAAVGGICMGAATHIAFSAIGISALVAASPVALALLGWAGAAYIVWLGAGFLRSSGAALPLAAAGRIAPAEAWRRGVTTNLLNPKAYLFMLVVFPQFIRAGGWPAGVQALVLGALLLAIAVPIYSGLALAAAQAGQALVRRPETGRIINRGAGLVLVALGLALAAGQAIETLEGLK